MNEKELHEMMDSLRGQMQLGAFTQFIWLSLWLIWFPRICQNLCVQRSKNGMNDAIK